MEENFSQIQQENYIQLLQNKYYEKYHSYPELDDVELLMMLKKI